MDPTDLWKARDGTRLGTNSTRFTVNGRPAFLFGVSYYGALQHKKERRGRDSNPRWGLTPTPL